MKQLHKPAKTSTDYLHRNYSIFSLLMAHFCLFALKWESKLVINQCSLSRRQRLSKHEIKNNS